AVLLALGFWFSATAREGWVQPGDEATIRSLIERYFAAYAREDLDAITRMWSDNSPELAANRKRLEGLFAGNERIEVKMLSIRRIEVDGDAARARVSVEISAIEAKTGRPATGFGSQNCSFQLVKERGGWKISREETSEQELASLLVNAINEKDRQDLLD